MRSNSAWMLGLAHNNVSVVMTASLDDQTIVRRTPRGPANTENNLSALGREVMGMTQNGAFQADPQRGPRGLQILQPTPQAQNATFLSLQTPRGIKKHDLRRQLDNAGVDVGGISRSFFERMKDRAPFIRRKFKFT